MITYIIHKTNTFINPYKIKLHKSELDANSGPGINTISITDFGRQFIQTSPPPLLETLQERIKVIEHQIYPLVIDDFAEGKIRLIDGRIVRR